MEGKLVKECAIEEQAGVPQAEKRERGGEEGDQGQYLAVTLQGQASSVPGT